MNNSVREENNMIKRKDREEGKTPE